MFQMSEMQGHLKVITTSNFSYEGQDFTISFTQAGVMVDQAALKALSEKEAEVLEQTLTCYEVEQLRRQTGQSGELRVRVNGECVVLREGEHFHLF